MATINYVRLFVRSWSRVLLVTVLGAVLAVGFSLFQPLRYSSTERILITQTNAAGLDPYTAIKSTERVAQNLGEIIYTSSFFNSVTSKPTVDATYFSTDEITRRKEWKNTIETNVVAGTGVMSIVAYHTNRDQARELSVDVAKELAAVAPDYFGYSIRVQIIDDPLPSRFYAKPDFLKIGLFGAVMGFLIASAWILGRIKSNP